MKQLITILVMALSFNVMAQIPKNATGILISDSISKDKMISVLMSNGYVLKDVNDYLIKTDVKSVREGMTTVNLDVVCTKVNNGYLLTAFISMGGVTIDGTGFGSSRSAAIYRGMDKSPNKIAFREIEKISDSFHSYEYKF
jgi:hypothetical protein